MTITNPPGLSFPSTKTTSADREDQLRVLMILDHAPDYRESFFRELGKFCGLTVVAQPCDESGLSAPLTRMGYEYVEIRSWQLCGVIWQPGLERLCEDPKWDILCVAINVRHLARIAAFLGLPGRRTKWVWRGHIFGRTDSRVLNLLRRYLLMRAAGCLTYSDLQVGMVKRLSGVSAVSFNNTEVRRCEFRAGIHRAMETSRAMELRMLFVGRFQPRKKLERLIELADRREDVYVRLVGPGMDALSIPDQLFDSGRVQLFGKTSGGALNPHFDWADLVVSPGHVGLLVMNAARHGKGIAIDASSQHAPEFWLAKEAGQPFIDFGSRKAVDSFLDEIGRNRDLLSKLGAELQRVAQSKYTIEYMAAAHMTVFCAVARNNE